MTSIFETQSVFTILDKATPVLESLAKKMEGLNDFAKTLQTSLSAISTINVEVGDTFSSINRRMTSTIGRMERLTVATRQYQGAAAAASTQTGVLAASMVGGSRGGTGARSGTGGGGGGGASGSNGSKWGLGSFGRGMTHGAGISHAMTSIPGMAAGYMTYMGINKAANLEDAVNRSLVAMNISVDADYMSTPLAQTIQNSILQASQNWGRPINDTSSAALDIVRLLAPRSNEERMALLPSLLDFAGAETRGKPGTTMDEAAGVAISLAHQLRNYSPAQIEPVLKQFAQLSMATHSSLTQFARASSYYLPLLNAGLNMDAGKLMAIGTVGSQMGLNTKSGTWLAQMFTAPMTADLTGTRGASRRKALMQLGLLDNAGHLIHMTDPLDFLATVGEHAAALSPNDRILAEKAAFGQQGARGASIFADKAVLSNIDELVKQFKDAPNIAKLHEAYQKSPLTQLQQQEQAFNTQITKLGEYILPLATDALRGFVMAIEGISVIANAFSPKTISKNINSTPGGQKLGDTFYNWADGLHDGPLRNFLFGGNAPTKTVTPPPSSGKTIVVHHASYLNGRSIYNSTTQYLAEAGSRPSTSGSGFDGRMTRSYSGW